MLVIILSVVLIIITLLIRSGMKGVPRSMSNLKMVIEQLLKRGYDGGTLVIDHTKSKRFVQLRKYIKRKEVYGIELYFPLIKEDKEDYQSIKALVESHELSGRTEKSHSSDDVSFYCVDFKHSSDKAFELVKLIFIELYKLSDEEMFFTLLENASLSDELITSP